MPIVSQEDKEKKTLESYGIDEEKLQMLKNFVKLLKLDPSVLSFSCLDFFRNWLVNDLGAEVPDSESHPEPERDTPHQNSYKPRSSGDAWKEETKVDDMEDEEEDDDDSSEFEDDKEGVISGDNDDPPQDMGDDSQEVTEEAANEANDMKMLGIDALNNGDAEGAIKHFTSGIRLDSTKTVLFIKRATAYLRLMKPYAATRDAEKALSINPDSAASHKVLGKAQRLLGNWEEACHHLEEAQKIDFDDGVVEILKEIKPKATRIRDHQLRKERKMKEKDMKKRRKKAENIKKAQEKARREQEARDRENMANAFKFAEGMPGGASFGADPPEADDFDEKEDEEPKITEVADDLD